MIERESKEKEKKENGCKKTKEKGSKRRKKKKKIKNETKKIIQGQATETRKRKVSIIDVNDFDDTQPKTSKSQKREHCEVCGQILNEQNIWFVCKVCGNYCCSNCHDEDDFDRTSILTHKNRKNRCKNKIIIV